jgi:hypothetical protein
MSERQYYSLRTGKNPLQKLDLGTLLAIFKSIYDGFLGKDYFQEAFGYICVDAGDVAGVMGGDIGGFFLRKLRKPGLWPINTQYQVYSEDDLFDVVELLHDYISKPVEGRYHSYNDCGWHYSTFDRLSGQEEWRRELNEYLKDYGDRYELTKDGEIILLGPKGMDSLLEAELPEYDMRNVNDRVDAAIQQFRRSRSSLIERRDAIRNLGDVLEYLRPKVKSVLTKDEDDLFNILNNFGIRHHNERQKTDYEERVFLSWLFYHYLAAIHASMRLIAEREKSE